MSKKLNSEELRDLVKGIISEAKGGSSSSDELKELLPGTDSDLVSFASKVDDLIEDFIKKAEELREEGSEIVAKDILGSAKIDERNRFVMARIGIVQKLKSLMIQAHETLKRES